MRESFTSGRLVRRSIRFFFRSHAAVALGLVISSTILTGSLMVGDSVRASLEGVARLRLGRITHAVDGGDRMFRAALADALPDAGGFPVVPVLAVPGSVSLPSGSRVNGVQVVGVDERFWQLADAGEAPGDTSGAWVNEALAGQLAADAGQALVVRMRKPSALPADAPMAQDLDQGRSLRVTLAGMVDDAHLGRFNLRNNQETPPTLFVGLAELQDAVEQVGRANLLLIGAIDGTRLTQGSPSRYGGGTGGIEERLAEAWTVEDAQVRVAESDSFVSIRSERIFIDEPVAEAALALPGAMPILTYVANGLAANDDETPYSMATGIPAGLWPDDIGYEDDAMLVHPWLARDLQLEPGHAVTVRYFAMGPMRQLVETQAVFRVAGILDEDSPLLDRTLMPDFPGMTDSENCRDWEPGFPLDLDRIRDEDEAYWDAWRGTPKVFVPLASGQALWANRFGSVTEVRLPAGADTAEQVAAEFGALLDPAALGIVALPVRERAERATREAMNFGQLFVSFSFFLVAAALLLSGLLLVFQVEQRSAEAGILLAVGFRPARVRRLWVREMVWIAVAASAVGALLGAGYTRLVLAGLDTLWRDAIGGTPVVFSLKPATLATGWLVNAGAAIAVLSLTLSRAARRPVAALLRGASRGMEAPQPMRIFIALVVAVTAAGAGAGAAYRSLGAGAEGAPGFFQAGGLLLIAGLAAAYAVISRFARPATGRAVRPAVLTLGNLARRRGRSMAALAMLAGGCFMIVGVSVYRLDPDRDLSALDSGTGGFTWWARLSQPFTRDPNRAEDLEAYNMDPAVFAGTQAVPLRVRAGDEASCLNLNRAQQPRLLGVDPARLAGRFSFAKLVEGDDDDPWASLADWRPGDAIPAVADLNSMLWALGKKPGDTVAYVDERGRSFDVRLVGGLANSILQGSLLIDERAFISRFPSASGYGWLLIDTPEGGADAVADELRFGLADAGITLTRTSDRMAALDAVQNTYLAIFQMLGAFGVLLGSAGLGIVVLRNVLERRSELAVMRAMGFARGRLARMVVREHGWLLAAGVVLGAAAAAVAVLPVGRAMNLQVPYGVVGLWLGAVFLNGLVWVMVAAGIALRGDLMATLREE